MGFSLHSNDFQSMPSTYGFLTHSILSFFEGKKIIIDKVSFSDLGFDNELPNGTILKVEPKLVIKTSNGSVKLDVIRCDEVGFTQNQILL